VLSTGYGVVSADQKISPYSATFATRHADSVVRGQGDPHQERQTWIATLAEQEHSLHRPLSRLGQAHEDLYLVVLSRPYLQAVLPELERLRELAGDRLAIVTADCPEMSKAPWWAHWVPSHGALRGVVRGTMVGLHARVARHLVSQVPPARFGATALRELVQELANEAPPITTPTRQPMSDDAVREFIRGATTTSWSGALRELRAGGRACEQGRFRKLFKELRTP
jgi:hypothetical protein